MLRILSMGGGTLGGGLGDMGGGHMRGYIGGPALLKGHWVWGGILGIHWVLGGGSSAAEGILGIGGGSARDGGGVDVETPPLLKVLGGGMGRGGNRDVLRGGRGDVRGWGGGRAALHHQW